MKLPLTAFDYAHELSMSLNASGRYCRAGSYRSVSRSVFRFCDDESLSLKALFSHEFLRDYEAYLARTGCVRNTVSFYMNTLRSIYNKAVKSKHLSPVSGLFKHIFTGSAPTVKRAVNRTVIARIIAGDLSAKPRLEVCRDILLLSLELQGMAFIDMAYLRKSDIQGDLIVYCRRKTGGMVQVVMLPEARALFNKYANQVKDSPYLLPLITKSGEAGHRQYKSALHRQNRQLMELTDYLGIEAKLTTYVFRHSWATYAYHGGISVGVISQGMGHHTEEVTRTYLSAFERSELERANYVVLRTILSPIVDGEAEDASPEKKAEAIRRVEEVERYLNQDGYENNMLWRRSKGAGRDKKTRSRRKEASRGNPVNVLK